MIASDAFLYEHVARMMDSRLEWIRRRFGRIVISGADWDISRALLHARYSEAELIETDGQADRLAASKALRPTSWWRRNAVMQHTHDWGEWPHAPADMVWANLSLMRAPEPEQAMAHWAGCLKDDGMLFFQPHRRGHPQRSARLAQRSRHRRARACIH